MRPGLLLEAWYMGTLLVHIKMTQKSPSNFFVSNLLRKELGHNNPLLWDVKAIPSSKPESIAGLPCRYHAVLGQAVSAHTAIEASSVRVTAYQPFDFVERRLYVHMHD